MADDGFGSGIWKNLQAVRLGKDGGIEAPVRADGRDGIVVGRDAIAKSEHEQPEAAPPPEARRRRGWRRWLRR